MSIENWTKKAFRDVLYVYWVENFYSVFDVQYSRGEILSWKVDMLKNEV